MKVLIVDDEVLVRKGLSMGIDWKSLGFDEVKEAGNGLEALEYARQAYPELVFTDIKMPKMNGLQLIDAIKASCPDTVIIVLSCMNDSESIREAMKFNRALDYIPKLSMSTEELLEIVKKAKKFIKKTETPVKEHADIPKIHIFNLEKENALRHAVECDDLSEVKKVIAQCFSEAETHAYSLEQFIDWHEIYAILSSILKQYHGCMSSLGFLNQNVYEYIRQSENLQQMNERFADLARIYMDELRLLKNKLYHKEINEATAYILKNYQKPLKLSDIAQYVGMNESYLSRLFKKTLNINFVDYLNQVRINKAKELLSEQELTVAEIAYRVGYQNESYFSRIFKTIEGVSPKKYSKNRTILT